MAPGNRLLRAASPTAGQSGGGRGFQVAPCLLPRPVSAPAEPADLRGWLRGTGTRRGEVTAASQPRTSGTLSDPSPCGPGDGRARRCHPNCRKGGAECPRPPSRRCLTPAGPGLRPHSGAPAATRAAGGGVADPRAAAGIAAAGSGSLPLLPALAG